MVWKQVYLRGALNAEDELTATPLCHAQNLTRGDALDVRSVPECLDS
jgi:hypothetical protein